MGGTARGDKKRKHAFSEINLFFRTYQHITNENKTPNAQLIRNSTYVYLLEKEERNFNNSTV